MGKDEKKQIRPDDAEGTKYSRRKFLSSLLYPIDFRTDQCRSLDKEQGDSTTFVKDPREVFLD